MGRAKKSQSYDTPIDQIESVDERKQRRNRRAQAAHRDRRNTAALEVLPKVQQAHDKLAAELENMRKEHLYSLSQKDMVIARLQGQVDSFQSWFYIQYGYYFGDRVAAQPPMNYVLAAPAACLVPDDPSMQINYDNQYMDNYQTVHPTDPERPTDFDAVTEPYYPLIQQCGPSYDSPLNRIRGFSQPDVDKFSTPAARAALARNKGSKNGSLTPLHHYFLRSSPVQRK